MKNKMISSLLALSIIFTSLIVFSQPSLASTPKIVISDFDLNVALLIRNNTVKSEIDLLSPDKRNSNNKLYIASFEEFNNYVEKKELKTNFHNNILIK